MIKGTYIFSQDGQEIYRSKNVITKFGKRFFTNFIAGNINDLEKDMAFGIGSTAASEDDTRLEFEFYRVPVTLGATNIQTANNVTTYSVIYKTTIPQDVAGEIKEVGIYPSTRSSINNFDSKFLSDFYDSLDWKDENNNNPQFATTGVKVGDNVLTMTSNSTSARQYTQEIDPIDFSGYSVYDSIKLAFYRNDVRLSSVKVRFYSSNNGYYEITLSPSASIGYYLSPDILMSTVFAGATTTPAPDRTAINKIGIIITPTTGNETSIGMDGLRINDEDTFDPSFGLISRSVLATALSKATGRAVDVEYKLDLDF
jgi:hypothetical protein